MTHVLRRAVTICAAAGALAGCAGYEPFEGQAAMARPQYPIRVAQAETSPVNPTAPYAVSAPPSQAPLAAAPPPVESRPLEPAAAPVSNPPAYVTPSTPQVTPGYPLPPPISEAPAAPTPVYPPAAPYAPPAAASDYPTPAPQPPLEPAPPPPMIQRVPPPVIEAPPPPPRMLTVTKTTVTGKVVEIDGPPRTYVVQKGDHLDAIGRKVGLERDDLAERNKLKEPYRLKPGQVLKLPSAKRKAYVVTPGDTLFSIAKRFGVTAKALGAENGLKPGAALKPGQKVRLPEGYRDQGPIKTVSRVPAPAPEAPPTPQYARPAPMPAPPPPQYARPTPAPAAPPPQYARPVPTPAPTTPAAPRYPAYTPSAPPSVAPAPAVRAPPPSPPPVARPAPGPSTAPTVGVAPPSAPLSDQQITDLGRGRFQWPLQGEIISAFGPRGTGQRNDGVNIRGDAGQPVRAAAAGDVVYSGDQVPGFGNLVLVKHADGWVTAYGHLARTDVKMQQRVAQGQQIGQVGATGGVAEPQLHFEVRYAPTPTERARPVDPALVLPK